MPKYKSREIDWDKEWRLVLVGGVAGSLAKTSVAPLDRVKILFQVRSPEFAKYNASWFGPATAIKDIFRADGLRGIFRGHSATLLRIFPYSALKYSLYDKITLRVIPSKEYDTFFRNMVSGSLTGTSTLICTYPLDYIRVRLAVETKHNFVRPLRTTIWRIYSEIPPTKVALGGQPAVAATAVNAVQNVKPIAPFFKLSNFYRGFSASILGMIPYSGASFSIETQGRKWMNDPRIAKYTTKPRPAHASPDDLAPLNKVPQLVVGGTAGFVAQTLSYPVEVIRRRIQVGGLVGDGRRLGIRETARTIFHEGGGNFKTLNGLKGLKGFFVGMSLGYVKIVPLHAVSFFIWREGTALFGVQGRE